MRRIKIGNNIIVQRENELQSEGDKLPPWGNANAPREVFYRHLG